jgi:PAS domain S-box-containing protein
MPAEDRAGEADRTGSGSLDEVTLRALIEHIPVTVYIDRLDETGSNVYTSPQLEAELGYTVEEWVSDKDFYAKVLHPEDRDWVLAEYARRRDSDCITTSPNSSGRASRPRRPPRPRARSWR